ncbi:MAG: RES domain-containing protein [Arcicella sp.]|jgi:RES domain-containing protein|nr:RES domain-containing protein [Arcicella sp.]
MKLYRLQSARYGLPNDFLSGKGAELTGGRWNPVGMPVVYTSRTVELASLEYLVHYFEGFPNSKLPDLLVGTIEINESDILTIEAEMLPKNWRNSPAPTSLQKVSKEWFHNKKFLALQLPTAVHSAQTELSFNVLLNPLHEAMNLGVLTKIESFYFDSRYQKPQIQGHQMSDLIEDILGTH